MGQESIKNDGFFDLTEIMSVLWSKKWIILLIGLLTAISTFLTCNYLLEKQYKSSTKVYVLNQKESDALTYNDLQLGSQLTKDYQELIVSRPVIEKTIQNLNLDMTYESLARKISVTVPKDTRIITITVTHTNNELARDIANTVREIASNHISEVMRIEAVNLVEEANLPTTKASPHTTRNTLAGALVGMALAAALSLVIHVMDDTIKTPDDVKRYLDISVLGTITKLDEKKKKKGKGAKEKD